MGLRETLAKAVNAAFVATGNIPEAMTYRRTSSAYNPATGTNVITNTDYTVAKSFWLKFESFEIDKLVVLGSDVKVIIQSSSLSVTPNIATDQIIRTSDGKVYNILRVSKDPAGSTITMQLRSPS